jgi:rRNA maturation endonuclease Nob1
MKVKGIYRGICIRCKSPFVGPGDRCQSCADDLRKRRRPKPR